MTHILTMAEKEMLIRMESALIEVAKTNKDPNALVEIGIIEYDFLRILYYFIIKRYEYLMAYVEDKQWHRAPPCSFNMRWYALDQRVKFIRENTL